MKNPPKKALQFLDYFSIKKGKKKPSTMQDSADDTCFISARDALAVLDPKLYDNMEAAFKRHGYGTINDLRGLPKPAIYEVLSSLGQNPADPEHAVVCPSRRGRVADVLIKYFHCTEGVNDEDSSANSADVLSQENTCCFDKDFLAKLMPCLRDSKISLKSMRGLTRTQLINIFTTDTCLNDVVRDDMRECVADALIAYFKQSAEQSNSARYMELLRDAEAAMNLEKQGVPFVASLVQLHEPARPFKNTMLDDLLTTSDLAIWLGARENVVSLFRSCVIEFVLSALFTAMHICIIRTALADAKNASVPISVTIGHLPLIVAMIYAGSAASGSHFNFLVSFSTCLTGMQTVARMICYIIAQLLGASVGATWLLFSVGGFRTPNSTLYYPLAKLAVCTAGDLNAGELFMGEFLFSFTVLFLLYGIILEPKQLAIFGGPAVAPVFFVLGLGSVIYASMSLDDSGRGGGPVFNVVPCFGASVATSGMAGAFETTHWVYFLAQMAASVLHAVLFYTCPPNHATEGMWLPVLLREKRAQLLQEQAAMKLSGGFEDAKKPSLDKDKAPPAGAPFS